MLLGLPLLAMSAEPAPPPPGAGPGVGEPQPERSEWSARSVRIAARAGDLIGSAIFDIIEDLDLYTIDLGAGSAEFSIGRRVYDNHDVLGSYTVADRFVVKLQYPLYSWSETINNTFTATFGVGTNHSLDFLHIRQIRPTEFDALTSGATPTQELFSPGWQHQAADSQGAPAFGWDRLLPAAGRVMLPNSEDAFDGLGRGRWGSLWNLLVVPFRVPTKPEWIERISPGDIVSWRGSGTIEVGPGIDLGLTIPGALSFYDASLTYRLFVNGDFRISVLREDQHHVRVKVTQTAIFGDRLSFGGSTDGIISDAAIANSNPFERLTRVSPWSLSRSRSTGTGIDVVFRYDLRDPAARLAYRSAVFGNLSTSDELSGGTNWHGQDPSAPVRRIGIQKRKTRSAANTTGSRIGSFYRHYHNAHVEHAELLVDVGEGPVRVLRSQSSGETRWRWFWGAQERIETEVTVWADRDRLDAGADDAVTLTVTHEIIDTLTSGNELLTYIDLMESATGRTDFFPRPPAYHPDEVPPTRHGRSDFDRRWHRDVPLRHPTRLGRTSFFAQVTYSQDQIQRFLDVPQHERWRDLEIAFGVPPGTWGSRLQRNVFHSTHILHTLLNTPLYPFNRHLRSGSMLYAAESAARSWRASDRSKDLHQRLCLLVELFSSRRYGFELTRLLRLRLADEPVSYAIKGSSYVFGTMRDEGKGTAPLSPLPEQMTEIINFDTPRARRHSNQHATLSGLDIDPLDHDRLRIRLTIAAEAQPVALYARLIERRPWSLSRSVGAAVVAQLDQPLRAGVNEWIIDRRAGPLSNLLGRTEPGVEYEFIFAISLDGRTWGPIESDDFIIPTPPSGARDILRPRLIEE